MAQPEPKMGPAGAHRPSVDPRRNVLGSGIFGNVVEWYDFALYGYLAPVTAPLRQTPMPESSTP